MLREATDEAQRLREEAEVEAARRRQDASADAESELVMAKQQGREMVNEARAYRERVLSELARRRELARQQIEQLMHGRDRLLQAFERSRLVAVDVMAELTPLGEPTEYVNLSPTTGPVPLMVPNQRADARELPIGRGAKLPTPSRRSRSTVVETRRARRARRSSLQTSPTKSSPRSVEVPRCSTDVEADDDNTVVLMRDMHEIHDHDERDDAARGGAGGRPVRRRSDDEGDSVDDGPTRLGRRPVRPAAGRPCRCRGRAGPATRCRGHCPPTVVDPAIDARRCRRHGRR